MNEISSFASGGVRLNGNQRVPKNPRENREPAISVDRCAVTHKKDSTREPPPRARGHMPCRCVPQSAEGLARGRNRSEGGGPVSGYLSSRRLRASAPPRHGGQVGRQSLLARTPSPR